MNSDLLKTRLAQYGVAWLLAFILGLILPMAVPPLAHMRLVQVADLYLPAAFLVLGLALAAGLILGLLSSASLPAKLGLVLLALILVLPLFWAPVLGTVLAAYLTHASIEYSQAYAGFRILIANMIFPLSQVLFQGALWETVWKAFQLISTLIGGLVSLYQGWGILQNLLAPRRRSVDMEMELEG